ncbi:hypothetical protein D3C76_828440 [compost metagenome]
MDSGPVTVLKPPLFYEGCPNRVSFISLYALMMEHKKAPLVKLEEAKQHPQAHK